MAQETPKPLAEHSPETAQDMRQKLERPITKEEAAILAEKWKQVQETGPAAQGRQQQAWRQAAQDVGATGSDPQEDRTRGRFRTGPTRSR